MIRFDNYRAWRKVNPRPMKLASPIAQLCRGATPKELALDARSPHNERFFTVYVNDAGKARMFASRDASSRFPVGTVIVKEKLTAERGGRVELITGMIKRPAGFDRASGNWQYFVADAKGKIQPTATDHCRSCHETVKHYDYVYRTYLPSSISSRRLQVALRVGASAH